MKHRKSMAALAAISLLLMTVIDTAFAPTPFFAETGTSEQTGEETTTESAISIITPMSLSMTTAWEESDFLYDESAMSLTGLSAGGMEKLNGMTETEGENAKLDIPLRDGFDAIAENAFADRNIPKLAMADGYKTIGAARFETRGSPM
jgi:hypothetical protein